MNENDTRPLMVSIWCITYNHEPYIRQCLEGFVMQKTNFRFEAIVHDDASTDGTAAIVREYAEKYPDIIKPIFEIENQYSKGDGSLDRIMEEVCTGKYVAFCEGDDYWIDPMKLQKQVDFLEIHPDFGLCYTNSCKLLNGKLLKSKTLSQGKCDFHSLLFHNDIATLTVMCRKDILSDYDNSNFPSSKWLMGDYPKWLFISTKMKIHYLDLVTSVYRVLPESASHSTNMDKQLAFLKSTYDIRRYFANHYLSELEKSNVLSALESNEIWEIFRVILGHNKKDAYRFLLENRDKMTFQMYLKALLLIFKF